MNIEIKVIDDFLPEEVFGALRACIMHPRFEWYLGNTVDSRESSSPLSLSHHFNNPDDTFHYPIINEVSDYVTEEHLDRLIRIRIGAIFRDSLPTIHQPHVDHPFPHMTALLYVNESDGDTNFYDVKYPGEKCGKDILGYLQGKDLTPCKTVSPKPNRLVVFDGMIYHSSSTPVKDQVRMAVNINFFSEENVKSMQASS